jgi:fermentation-respiration switch protein FrsA (DUF1100 family)
MIPTLKTVLILLIAAYLLTLLLARFFEPYLVFAPQRHLHATPNDVGLSYEEVSLTTVDGIQLSAWYVRAPAPRGVVLFCHGNAGNNAYRLESLSLLHNLRLDTLIFDYRGYGKSSGRPSEQGTYRDAEAAWDYLVADRDIPPSRIVVFGRSLGGAIALHVANYGSPAALIVESAFTSIRDLGSELYPILPVRLLSTIRYDAISRIGHVSCPLLVIHSKDDEMIGVHHGERLFESAPEPKRFLVLSGSHNEGFLQSAELYSATLDAFIRDFVDPIATDGQHESQDLHMT